MTVKLKDGLFWDDGVPFTSKDVKADFIMKGGFDGATRVWDYLDSIDTPDDQTVVFNFKEKRSGIVVNYILEEYQKTPYHKFEKWLEPAEELLNLRKEGLDMSDKESFNKKFAPFIESLREYQPEFPLGCGPFKVTKVTPSDMVLEKVEKYPNIENVDIDKVIVSRGNTNEIMWSLLKAGDLDVQECASPPDVVEAITSANPNIKHIVTPYFTNIGLFPNHDRYPFNDLRFRKALAYIIDRDTAREIGSYYGTTIDKISGLLPSNSDLWIDDSELNPYEHNLVKAEELLKDMGMTKNTAGFWCSPEGEELNLEFMLKQGATDDILMADEISRELQKFGIKTNLKVTLDALYADLLKNRLYDMALGFTFSPVQHPYEGYARMYEEIKNQQVPLSFSRTVVGQDGEEINLTDLTKELLVEKDKEKQKEMIQTLAWATNEYLPVIDIYSKNAQFFIDDGSRVTGWPEGDEFINGLSSFRRGYPTIWMLEGKLKGVKK